MADGKVDKGRHGQAESAQVRKILPAGALLVEWEPDPERGEDSATVMWLVLHPDKWNKEGHLQAIWRGGGTQKSCRRGSSSRQASGLAARGEKNGLLLAPYIGRVGHQ